MYSHKVTKYQLTKHSHTCKQILSTKIVLFIRPQPSHEASYENIDNANPELELHALGGMLMESNADLDPERVPLDARQRRPSMKRLVRQASTVNTQKTNKGTMKLTYWF